MDNLRRTFFGSKTSGTAAGASPAHSSRLSSGTAAASTSSLSSLSSSSSVLGMRQYWMPDAVSRSCYECGSKFTTFRRRHHCRVCGQIFCNSCSDFYISGQYVGAAGTLRVCSFCHKFFEQYTQNGGDASATAGSVVADLSQRRTSVSNVFLLSGDESQHDSPGFKAPSSASPILANGSPGLAVSDTLAEMAATSSSFLLKDGRHLELLAKQISGEDGIPLVTVAIGRKAYIACFTGHELVSWIRKKDCEIDLDQVLTICQALLDEGYIEDLQERGRSAFQNDNVPYKPVLAEERAVSRSSEEASGPEWLQSVEVATNSHRDYAKNISKEENVAEKYRLEGLPDVSQLSVDHAVGEQDSADENLEAVYEESLTGVLRHLLHFENLSYEKWSKLILSLVRSSARALSIDYKNRGDDMDARAYVKVKCIPGGGLEESSLVYGEVFSNNVIRKGMPVALERPKILLVSGSISFHRGDVKYVCLDNLHLQEEEYVKKICSKISSFNPNLILVEQTVCRPVQDVLQAANVALVLNVKPKVLERVSRFFEVAVVSNLGSILHSPALGTCESYRNELFCLPNGRRKNLIYLEGSGATGFGCSVLLRGGSVRELSKVKRIFRQLLLHHQNGKYEKALLLCEFAKPSRIVMCDAVSLEEMTLSPFLRVQHSQSVRDGHFDRSACDEPDVMKEISILASPSPTLVIGEDTESSSPPDPELVRATLVCGTESSHVRNMIAEYRASIGERDVASPFRDNANVFVDSDEAGDVVDAFIDYRPFPVLFSSHSPKSRASPYYCVLPWIVNMHLYSSNDLPLGAFLETFCFSNNYVCPNKVCDTPMKDHIRRFCHSTGSITMFIQELSAPISPKSSDDEIVLWKFCTVCKNITPISPLSPSAWMYSFAMFLMMLFYEDGMTGHSESEDAAAAPCLHSIHQQHLTCFAKRNIVATFRFDSIMPYGLGLPQSRIEIPARIGLPEDNVRDECRALNIQGPSIFSAIFEELIKFKPDFGLGAFEDIVKELLDEHESDFEKYRSLLRHLNGQTDEVRSLEDSLFASKKYLADSVSKWRVRLESLHELKKKEERVLRSERSRTSASVSSSTSDSVDWKARKMDDWMSLAPSNLDSILPAPFPSNLHFSISSGQSMVVDEKQPSSLVAYTLASAEYSKHLSERQNERISDGATSTGNNHFEFQFYDETCRFYCCAYFARDYEKLRQLVFGPDPSGFVASLAQCQPWEASGGKSGLSFYKTKDDRFVLKQMSKFEFQSFQTFADNYFSYVQQAIETNHPTLLAKIFGVFRVGFKNSQTNTSLRVDLIVMENLFYGRNIKESYDLKGSIRNRLVDTNGKTDSTLVLLDENLLKVACERPLYVSFLSKQVLLSAITIDTQFLATHSMMDYSLLVGMDSEKNELVLGIIDYIRTFTWDKKLETLVKSSGILGGSGKSPTVISPHLYKRRFIEAMYKYFILVPDFCFQELSSAQNANVNIGNQAEERL